jgi:hypothetical protein
MKLKTLAPKRRGMRPMDEGARRWMMKTAKANRWRVAGYCDWDDLLQEGVMCWWRVSRNYPCSRPHQLMGSFKIAFINEINRMSCKTSAGRWLQYTDEPPEQIEGQGMLEMIGHAPEVIRRVLLAFQTDEGARIMRSLYRRRGDGTRERTDERINRMAGLPADTDFAALLRAYIDS